MKQSDFGVLALFGADSFNSKSFFWKEREHRNCNFLTKRRPIEDENAPQYGNQTRM